MGQNRNKMHNLLLNLQHIPNMNQDRLDKDYMSHHQQLHLGYILLHPLKYNHKHLYQLHLEGQMSMTL
jgi:hypothetical protein